MTGFVAETQQVICKAQGQPLFERLSLGTRYKRVEKNNGSEIKINYYWLSNIITRVENKRPNMGEFGTIRAYCYIIKQLQIIYIFIYIQGLTN